jgi:hypothetical protein
MFCLVEAPDRDVIEKHHFKLGLQCNWITQVKITTDFDSFNIASFSITVKAFYFKSSRGEASVCNDHVLMALVKERK